MVHLAARKQVGESVEQPTALLPGERAAASPRSWRRSPRPGVAALPVLLVRRRLRHARTWTSITEDTPCVPMNPYGETKLAGEWLVRAAGRAHGIVDGLSALLQRGGRGRARAGRHRASSTSSRWSSTGSPAARPRGSSATTTRRPDGTCVRDYIHVADLAEAHLAAARRLAERPGAGRPDGEHRPRRGRLGARAGRRWSARSPATDAPRRSSSRAARATPPRAVASADLAAEELGWTRAARGARDGRVGLARAGCLRTPEPARLIWHALTCGSFPQVRAHDNGVQCRVARYPPPVVHCDPGQADRDDRGGRLLMGAGHDHGHAHGARRRPARRPPRTAAGCASRCAITLDRHGRRDRRRRRSPTRSR